MQNNLKPFNAELVNRFAKLRDGEKKMAQCIHYPHQHSRYQDDLKHAAQFGIRYVLLGIPEDFGPRANMGRHGATNGWVAFLHQFLNLQANHSGYSEKILLLGEIEVTDLQQRALELDPDNAEQLDKLRNLVVQLDMRVTPVIEDIIDAGLEPIVIGGGHNNCYPIIKAAHSRQSSKIAVANLDPHADFRALEGRHSGNGFRYADHDQLLGYYSIIGLDEYKNNQESIEALQHAKFIYHSYQSIFVKRQNSFEASVNSVLAELTHSDLPAGIEVDMDAITAQPASALNYQGVSLADAQYFVFQLACNEKTGYLHLAESAPDLSSTDQMLQSGQALCALVMAYISARESRF